MGPTHGWYQIGMEIAMVLVCPLSINAVFLVVQIGVGNFIAVIDKQMARLI